MAGDNQECGGFVLVSPPPRLLRASRTSQTKVVPVYIPTSESSLPAGEWHGFVLDRGSRFRIKPGWTRKHADFVKGRPIGAAGHLRADEGGRLVEVDCQSVDYPIFVDGPLDRMVRYLMDAFGSSPDFVLSPAITFVFDKPDRTQLRIAADGSVRTQVELRIADAPRDLGAREDADSTPLHLQSPGRVEADGFGKRRAL